MGVWEEKTHTDKDLENAVDDTVQDMQEQEQKLKDDFKEYLDLEKGSNKPTPEDIIEKVCNNPAMDILLMEILKNRVASIDIKDAISDKRTETINTFVRVEEHQLWIKKRIGKWFIYVMLLSNVLSFILGGIANENKEVVYPILEKGYNIFSSLNKVKGE